ncbi:hypothetical protein Ahy_A02g009361 [Arachis hypogaea]|uniref:CCHC-type domain-containing protein n=1 Tax=Arachis hypogaea TaxID=3818 RepID=A0A445EGU8_ARAHY|nr:hypothetical protein Ahy_A02g009361 [Arachis hypogaea]
MPKPKKRVDVIAFSAMEWQAKWAGDLKFEVHHKNKMIMERFVVDLMAGKCSCRFWGLCGMPCPYACCAIFEKGDNPKDYCSNYYSKAAYLATVKPERLRMVRIREPDENRTQTKYRRTKTSVICSNYGQYGHNRRQCPNPIVTAPEGTQGPDVAAGNRGGDVVANEPGAAVEANRSEVAATATSRVGRGRATVGMERGRGRGRAVNTPAPPSQLLNTPAPPSQPPNTLAPPS